MEISTFPTLPMLTSAALIALTQTGSMSLTLSLLLEEEGTDQIQAIANFLRLEATTASELIRDWHQVYCIGSSLTRKSTRQSMVLQSLHVQLGLFEGLKWLKDHGIFNANIVLLKAVECQRFDIVEWAKANGATNYTPYYLTKKWNLDSTLDPSITDPNVILCYAALQGNIEDVQVLIPISTEYMLALKFACMGGHTEIARLLMAQPGIVRGADPGVAVINAVGPNNAELGVGVIRYKEPLKAAIQNGHLEIVHLFLDRMETMQAPDFNLYYAIIHAFEHNQIEIIKAILDRGVGIPNISVIARYACQYGNMEIARMTLDRLRGNENLTYILYILGAATNGHLDMIKMLIESALADGVSEEDLDYSDAFIATGRVTRGDTPHFYLQISIKNIVEAAKFLYEKLNPQFRLNIVNEAMIRAGMGGHIEIIQLMMEYAKEDPNPIPTYNWVLNNACFNDHLGIARFMVQHSANSYAVGLSMAIRGQFSIKIVRLMLEMDWNQRQTNLNYVGINYENMIALAMEMDDNVGIPYHLRDRSEVIHLLREYQQMTASI